MIQHSPQADYLGDGVYADVSEYGELLLTTEDGIDVTNRIVLEVPVVRALLRYIERHDCAQENGRDATIGKTLCQVFAEEADRNAPVPSGIVVTLPEGIHAVESAPVTPENPAGLKFTLDISREANDRMFRAFMGLPPKNKDVEDLIEEIIPEPVKPEVPQWIYTPYHKAWTDHLPKPPNPPPYP